MIFFSVRLFRFRFSHIYHSRRKIGNQLAYTQLIKDHFTYCCFEILAPHSKVPTTTSCIAWSLH